MDYAKNLSLQWKDHHSNLQTMFTQLLDRGDFSDVTLACEGQTLMAHRMVLCASSTYFDSILSKASSYKETIIVLRDFNFADLKCLIEYMYKGEVVVETEQLPSLLKAAKDLKIKGLGEETVKDLSKGAKNQKDSSGSFTLQLPTHKKNDKSTNKKRAPSKSDRSRSFKIPRIVNVQSATTSFTDQPLQTEREQKESEEDPMKDIFPKIEPSSSPSAIDENNEQFSFGYLEEVDRKANVEAVEGYTYEPDSENPSSSMEFHGTSSDSVVFNIYDVTDLTDEASTDTMRPGDNTTLDIRKAFITQCNCKLNCQDRISVKRQREIHASFRRLENRAAKDAFLQASFEERRARNDQPLTNRLYHLIDACGNKRHVCRQFFLSVLKISGSAMAKALASISYQNKN